MPVDQTRSEEKYVSPDGTLTFMVVREPGDISLGFHNATVHTHGDILASLFGLPVEEAVAAFVDAILSNKAVIAICEVDGRHVDTWISDDPDAPDPYRPENETVTFRYWNGSPYTPKPGTRQ
jgi:hypothetical protein